MEVENIYNQGNKTPSDILLELRDRHFEEPSMSQLYNFLARLKIKINGKYSYS